MAFTHERVAYLRLAHVQAAETLKHADGLESRLGRCPEDVRNATDAYTFRSYAFPILRPLAEELVDQSPVGYKKGVKQVLREGIGSHVQRYVSYAEWAYDENIGAARADYEQHADDYHSAAIAKAFTDGYETTFAGGVATTVTPLA